MKTSSLWHSIKTGALLLIAANPSAAEEPVRVENLPKSILQAVQSRYIQPQIGGASKELDNDGTVLYELELVVDDKNIDVIVTPSGHFRLIERRLAQEELPARVAKSLADNYPKATYKKLEEVTLVDEDQEYPPYYEARLVTMRNRALEVEMSADGLIIKESNAGN